MLSAEHRRPFAAFLLVCAAAAVIIGTGMRTQVVDRMVEAGAPRALVGAVAPDMVLGGSLRSAPLPRAEAPSAASLGIASSEGPSVVSPDDLEPTTSPDGTSPQPRPRADAAAGRPRLTTQAAQTIGQGSGGQAAPVVVRPSIPKPAAPAPGTAAPAVSSPAKPASEVVPRPTSSRALFVDSRAEDENEHNPRDRRHDRRDRDDRVHGWGRHEDRDRSDRGGRDRGAGRDGRSRDGRHA